MTFGSVDQTLPYATMGFRVEMQTILYLVYGAVLLAVGFGVFRRVLVREYLAKGRLGGPASLLQFAVFVAFFFLPYLYLPPEWAWDWLPNGTWNRLVAIVLLVVGMVLAFGTMAWFGMGRAFGVQVRGLKRTGVYRFSRYPQMVGGWLMVLGVFFYEPSAYGIGWLILWGFLGHWMVTTEETHLQRVFGDEYNRYVRETPRYLVRS